MYKAHKQNRKKKEKRKKRKKKKREVISLGLILAYKNSY